MVLKCVRLGRSDVIHRYAPLSSSCLVTVVECDGESKGHGC